ncbi:MAG: class I SAM-dependent DNA methyltransferase [Burkholderiales bacterium]|nr:class I SAM-dependent DNA methyltransferase [Burkholderiales bacterium]
MTPAEFIAKWQDNKLSERAGAQAHFLDLCDLLGMEKPSDPDNYCFERGAKRTGAGRGWADVWKRHNFAWEYKAPGANLEAALKQLMTYALALDNPPLLVVSDRLRIEIHTHFTGTPSEVHTIALADIGTAENLQKLRWLFTKPDAFKPERTRTAITLQAAKLIGDLAWQMQQRGHEPHDVAHFLNKIIFCLFAEDAKGPASDPLLPDQIFSKILHNGRKDAARCQAQIKKLFTAMSTRHGDFGEHIIQWFNGGLFDNDLTLPLTADDIDKLVNVSLLDWSAIEPSIFGTLFERGLDPAKRSQLGAHYTDPVSIMRIVNPVIVEPLLAEWAVEKAAIAAQMDVMHQFENSRKSAEKAKATNALKDAFRRYIAFKEKLKNFKVLDPACGSGNFLYLALQSLKDIELRVDLEAESLGLERGFPEVGPQSMFGIELSPYAAELAKVTVWIGDIQWMLKHGFAPSKEPILKTLDQIECRDALANIRREERVENGEKVMHETVTVAQWPAVDVIIGNPPFLGGSKMREQLGDAYTEDIRELYGLRVPGGADLVCYWFAKAQSAIETGTATRAGLVATNSIRMAISRPVLQSIVDRGVIFEAWSDEEWVNEGASVRVSIVCFAPTASRHVLDGRVVQGVTADLQGSAIGSEALDVTVAKPLSENSGISFQGSQKIGPFDIEGDTARQWLIAPNPHQRPNSDVLKPSWNGLDVTRRSRDGWIIDFGTKMTESEAALYEEPFRYVVEHVKPVRYQNNRESYRKYWWRHGEPRIAMRSATAPLKRFIATPEVAKHRPFIWLDGSVLPDKKLIVIARDDDATFGIVSSRIHVTWALSLGGTLEDRPCYNPTQCFQTFPFPESNAGIWQEIAAAAKRLNELRENWLNPPDWVDVVPEVVPGYPDRIIPKPEYSQAIKNRTLTNLYNAREKGEVQWLEDAHRTLDAAVARAYGWDDYTPDMPDEEILRRLLKLNLERAALGR